MRSIGFRRLLVPVRESAESLRAVDVACRLAAEHASITIVSVIEVPPLLPLDAHMSEEETAARAVLAKAAAVADSYGLDLSTRLLRARDVAGAICSEAEKRNVELLVIGAKRSRRANGNGPAFGKTVRHVLKHAPCRVLVIGDPEMQSAPKRVFSSAAPALTHR